MQSTTLAYVRVVALATVASFHLEQQRFGDPENTMPTEGGQTRSSLTSRRTLLVRKIRRLLRSVHREKGTTQVAHKKYSRT